MASNSFWGITLQPSANVDSSYFCVGKVSALLCGSIRDADDCQKNTLFSLHGGRGEEWKSDCQRTLTSVKLIEHLGISRERQPLLVLASSSTLSTIVCAPQ